MPPLSRGRLEGDHLRCMYHGLKFAPSGACVEMPGVNTVPPVMRVRSYPMTDRHSALWIWMGPAERADESLIPPFVGVDDPGWHMQPGHMDYDVNYTLVQDNLLDLSHVAYVHRDSFGGGSEETVQAWSDAEVRVSQLDRGVRVERWMRNSKAPRHVASLAGDRCDVLSSFDYLVPGVFLLTTRHFGSGAFERAGGGMPAEEAIAESFRPRPSRRSRLVRRATTSATDRGLVRRAASSSRSRSRSLRTEPLRKTGRCSRPNSRSSTPIRRGGCCCSASTGRRSCMAGWSKSC